mmetsp:Transcript_111394/g.278914  ORF Transcript_111394/g.278914 Transcript_111394/m.278914 type:complete len:258 (-) Transcript_111394:167-940(-)
MERLTSKEGSTTDAELCVELQQTICARTHLDVPYMQGWPREQVDVSSDASQPPCVLVLKVRAGIPAKDFHCKNVLTSGEMRSELELSWQFAVCAETKLNTIEPDLAAATHSTNVKEDFKMLLKPASRRLKHPSVRANRIVAGVLPAILNRGGLRVETILDIGVDREAMSIEFPIPWHWHLTPLTVVETRSLEASRCTTHTRRPCELPETIQGQKPGGTLWPSTGLRELWSLDGKERCSCRLPPGPDSARVEPLPHLR